MHIKLHKSTELTADETAALQALSTAVYPPEIAAKLPGRSIEWAPAQWRVICWNELGQALSHVGVVLRDGQVDGSPVKIGGVGGVKTHPSLRRRGLASTGITRAIQFFSEQKVDFALLVCEPDIVPIYERMGWRPFSGRLFVTQNGERCLFTFNLPMIHSVSADGPSDGEIASIREEDLLPEGYMRVQADTSKTRKQKYGWLPDELYGRLKACAAGGWAFGRFSDDLRRLLFVSKRRPHHAVLVKEFTPTRLVGWMQDELARFNDGLEKAAENERKPVPERFTLHDFRRTAITGLQMAGVSEKETSVMVGATPEVIRRHYEKLDQLKIARQSVERRLSVNGVAGTDPAAPNSPRRHRAEQSEALDGRSNSPQTASA
jgi:hypothetical protein